MPWNNEIYFGFSDVKPWNDLKCDYSKTNVTSEDADENSVLNFYRALINLKTNDIRFSRGDFKLLHNANNLFCYSRTANEKSAYVLGNFSEETVSIKKYDLGIDESVNSVLLSNYHCSKINSEIKLKPYEIFVAE